MLVESQVHSPKADLSILQGVFLSNIPGDRAKTGTVTLSSHFSLWKWCPVNLMYHGGGEVRSLDLPTIYSTASHSVPSIPTTGISMLYLDNELPWQRRQNVLNEWPLRKAAVAFEVSQWGWATGRDWHGSLHSQKLLVPMAGSPRAVRQSMKTAGQRPPPLQRKSVSMAVLGHLSCRARKHTF